MSSKKQIFLVYIGIEKQLKNKEEVQKEKKEILAENFTIKEKFEFYDVNHNSNILYLKEFFLSNYGKKLIVVNVKFLFILILNQIKNYSRIIMKFYQLKIINY